MYIREKLRDIWEIVVIERFPRVFRKWYYTKVTVWGPLDAETERRLGNEGYIRRRLNSLSTRELSLYIVQIREVLGELAKGSKHV